MSASSASKDALGRRGVQKTAVLVSLTVAERRTLKDCESVVRGGLKTFYEVGAALAEINEQRLYREKFRTFQEYCSERWGISRFYAHRLVNAAEVRENLLPIGNIRLPENESQLRPLHGLAPAEARTVWSAVVAKAGDGGISAKDVSRAVADAKEVREKKAKCVNGGRNGKKPRQRGEKSECYWQECAFRVLAEIHQAVAKGEREETAALVQKLQLIVSVHLENSESEETA